MRKNKKQKTSKVYTLRDFENWMDKNGLKWGIKNHILIENKIFVLSSYSNARLYYTETTNSGRECVIPISFQRFVERWEETNKGGD